MTVVVIPPEYLEQASKIGDKLTFDGKSLIASDFFSQGAQAKATDYKYYLFTNKGVLAFREDSNG